MKLIVSSELKSRLNHAAANGSIIASDILFEIKKNLDVEKIIKGSANYFSTKRIRSNCDDFLKVTILFTACTKDVTNEHFPDKDNPQAPWFKENRADVEASTFVGYFKNLPEYNQKELMYFMSSICVDSKVTIKLYQGMNDFVEAYDGENYSPIAQSANSPLHGSCMRQSDLARNAADFYHNFAGAKIIVARDAASNILGRAVVWNNVIWNEDGKEETVTVLDRVYFTHDFVIQMIYSYARKSGIMLRRRSNDHSTPMDFIALNDIPAFDLKKGDAIDKVTLRARIPATKWHKQGAPYLDTFSELHIRDGVMELANKHITGLIASCRSTTGRANRQNYVCPKCGEIHSDGNHTICPTCRSILYEDTEFGSTLIGRVFNFKGKKYPSCLFRKGRPTPTMGLYLQIEKLYRC